MTFVKLAVRFRQVFYLLSKIRFKDGLTLLDNDQDVLAMCSIALVDLNKDVRIYFEHELDVMPKILSDALTDVVDKPFVDNTNIVVPDGEDAGVDEGIEAKILNENDKIPSMNAHLLYHIMDVSFCFLVILLGPF